MEFVLFSHKSGFLFFSCSVMYDSLQPHRLQHTRLPCPSLSPEFVQAHGRWVGNAIKPSHPLSLPSPLAFNLSQHQGFFQWVSSSLPGCQSIGASASASVLPMNIQDWFPLGLTGLISLQSKGLSRVFFRTTVRSTNSFALSLLYGPILISVHDY